MSVDKSSNKQTHDAPKGNANVETFEAEEQKDDSNNVIILDGQAINNNRPEDEQMCIYDLIVH